MPTPAAFFSLRTVPNTGSVGLWVCPTSARSVPFQELQQLPYQLQLTTALFQFPIWGEQAEVLTAPKLPWRPPLSPPQPPACCWPHAGLWGCLHPCVPMPSIALRGLRVPRSWQQGPTTHCLHPAVPRSLLFKLSVSAPCPMRACNLAGFSPAPGSAFFYSHGLLYSQEITGFSFVLIKIQSRRGGAAARSSLPRSPGPHRAADGALWGHVGGSQHCPCMGMVAAAVPPPNPGLPLAQPYPSPTGGFPHATATRAPPEPFIPWGGLGAGWICSFLKLFLKQGSPGEMGLLLLCVSEGCCWGKGGDVGLGGADLISRAAQPPYK